MTVQMFERAVELDPDFSLAYVELSMVHSRMYHSGYDRTPGRLEKAKGAIDKAFELQPELPEAHLALGIYYYWGYRQYDKALESLSIAEKDLQNNPVIFEFIGAIQKRQGRFEEAIATFKKAIKLSPQYATFVAEIGICYASMRNYEKADEYFSRFISLAPDQVGGYLYRAYNYLRWQGNLKKARSILEAMPKKSDNRSIMVWFWQEVYERNYKSALESLASTSGEYLEDQAVFYSKAQLEAQVYQLMGKPELARSSYDAARVLLEAMIKELPNDNRIHSSLGIVYAGLDRKEDAIREGKLGVALGIASKDVLRRPVYVKASALILVMVGEHDAALDQIEHLLSTSCGSTFSIHELRLDPRWDPLRDYPRYKKLLEKYK